LARGAAIQVLGVLNHLRRAAEAGKQRHLARQHRTKRVDSLNLQTARVFEQPPVVAAVLINYGVRQIASQFDVTRPAISQHLTVLRNAGLISERRAGTRRLYRARPSGIAELRAWLEEFWDDGLARLQRAAEQEEASGRTTGGD